MHWYVIHTKPRQEQRALLNLGQQGYECYLPLFTTEKLRQGSLIVVQEPLFARYLFIRLSTCQSGQSWAPIRSTQGVSRLVAFGAEPAKVDAQLIELLRLQSDRTQERARRLFNQGDCVQIKDGPFAGLQGIYQMIDGERRAMVLLEIMSKPSRLSFSPANLRKVGYA
jgi:transcriptional antiterminator RfaH